MSHRDTGRHPPDELLDHDDQRVLDAVAADWQARDPVPPRLVDRVTFAVGCHEVAHEVAAILSEAGTPVPATTRSGDDVRTLTFTTTTTTIMVQVTRTGSGRQRLDGWIEPMVAGTMRLQVGGGTRDAELATSGRFQFTDLAPATMRLLVVDDEGVPITVTPAFEW